MIENNTNKIKSVSERELIDIKTGEMKIVTLQWGVVCLFWKDTIFYRLGVTVPGDIITVCPGTSFLDSLFHGFLDQLSPDRRTMQESVKNFSKSWLVPISISLINHY